MDLGSRTKLAGSKDGPRAPLAGGQIARLRAALILLCVMVVISGTIYSSRLDSGISSRRSRMLIRDRFMNLTKVVISKYRVGQENSPDSLEEERHNIIDERDAFFVRPRPRLQAQPPPPQETLPLILAVTPTYARAFQELYVTRLASMIRTVAPPFLWIVVESPHKTEETASLLNRTAGLCLPLGRPNCRQIDYVHIETGEVDKAKLNKAVVHRNRGLEYIEKERLKGVVYFMDDDNSYTPQLFEELRKIKYLGVYPVGFLFTQEYSRRNPQLWNTPFVERPLVTTLETGEARVYGWETFEWFVPKPNQRARTFNIDMAGFGFRSELLWMTPNDDGYPKQPIRFQPTHMGFLEDAFLWKMVRNEGQMEPLGDKCTDVLVWHVHMEQDSRPAYPKGWFCEQPKDLVHVEDDDHSAWPFVINKTKHGVMGRGNQGGQFIYS